MTFWWKLQKQPFFFFFLGYCALKLCTITHATCIKKVNRLNIDLWEQNFFYYYQTNKFKRTIFFWPPRTSGVMNKFLKIGRSACNVHHIWCQWVVYSCTELYTDEHHFGSISLWLMRVENLTQNLHNEFRHEPCQLSSFVRILIRHQIQRQSKDLARQYQCHILANELTWAS